jgi:nucleotide-binding universal stress UspA family protein
MPTVSKPMSWAKIMAPLSGGEGDPGVAAAAVALAAPFDAEVAFVYTPADLADVMPWMGEGFMGGVQSTALESLKAATAAGEKAARKAAATVDYPKTSFVVLETPVWAGLSMEGRLSDVIVFNDAAARGRGALAEAFQQMVADEQRPILVARPGLNATGVVAVAWDGGKEASRAARVAVPLLQKAAKVVIIGAPQATSRKFEPQRLQEFFAARDISADIEIATGGGDSGPVLLAAAKGLAADILVAGAFGHPRLQEFIFGGTTRTLLNADGPSLFLSH